MAHATTTIRLADLAADQWGLLTRRQAEEAGVPRSTFNRIAAEGSLLERVAHGVYQLIGAPMPDHRALRAAWLQLAPGTPAWKRTHEQGLVSHRSAAALFGYGHLPADVHEFTLPSRRQTRRSDVRLHIRRVAEHEHTSVGGLLVTAPARIAADLLVDGADPEAVGHVVADALRSGQVSPGTMAASLAPQASRLGFRRGQGHGSLRFLLELVGDPATGEWLLAAAAAAADDPMNDEP